jgi:hypothetical protein
MPTLTSEYAMIFDDDREFVDSYLHHRLFTHSIECLSHRQ